MGMTGLDNVARRNDALESRSDSLIRFKTQLQNKLLQKSFHHILWLTISSSHTLELKLA